MRQRRSERAPGTHPPSTAAQDVDQLTWQWKIFEQLDAYALLRARDDTATEELPVCHAGLLVRFCLQLRSWISPMRSDDKRQIYTLYSGQQRLRRGPAWAHCSPSAARPPGLNCHCIMAAWLTTPRFLWEAVRVMTP
jgi:hypothetical protein